jgi:hypothetical protein
MAVTKLSRRRLYAGDLFGGLNSEEEQVKDRKIEIVNSPGLDSIIEGYKKAIKKCPSNHSVKDNYEACEDSIPKEYLPGDIAKFSTIFPQIQIIKFPIYGGDYCSGVYFSALINNCKKDSPILLDLHHYNKRLFYVGYLNSRKIIQIEGDVSEGLGDSMSGGKIILNGNAQGSLGELMSGGEIIVNGNPGHTFGYLMTGGTIRINGDLAVRGEFYGGEIYHYDKLKFKNGELCE